MTMVISGKNGNHGTPLFFRDVARNVSTTKRARYYAPPTFTSRDPLFEKYFWMSPYAYCANNPVKFADPTGMDDYEVNRKTGEITLYKQTDDKFDRLVAQNNKGEVKLSRKGSYKRSIEVDKEFINSQQIGTFHDGTEARIYKLSVAENKKGMGIDIFKFLSYNTEIEWGIASNGKESTICSGSSWHEWEGYRAALRYGKDLKFYHHSHPGNDALPFQARENTKMWIVGIQYGIITQML